jgi:methylase of polypeptide subunit release factors
MPSPSAPAQLILWSENGQNHSAAWRSERQAAPPARVQLADDTLAADTAYRWACEGVALLWRGDFANARHLLQALVRRADKTRARALQKPLQGAAGGAPGAAFHHHRQQQAQRARVLAMLLVPLDASYALPLKRAPDVRLACEQAWGAAGAASVVALRELLGVISAFEWRKKGVWVPALQQHIHPHYGVFSPVRGEYVQLVADCPLPAAALAAGAQAFDLGTGTGVLAAVLAQRGVPQVLATDCDARAVLCAQANMQQLGLTAKVSIQQADFFPAGRAALVVCNPPWLPARAGSALEGAVYDPGSRMLLGMLAGLAQHLVPGGEGWLVLSDLAEHLGLRTRAELLAAIQGSGLQVLGRLDTRPTHPKVADTADPLHAARAAEVTSLWRLAPVQNSHETNA